MTQTIEQLRWLGNYLADDAESKGIWQGSEGAWYCFAGAKKLEQLQAKVAELEAENARLSDGAVCGDCDGSGWLENRVEGRYPCTCMTEAEPYQLLAEQLAAEQLNNKLLREALEAVIKVHWYESGIPVEAISTKVSTEALDKYVSEKVKEWRNAYEKSAEAAMLLSFKVDELTKQRDLAVEALEKQGHSAGCRKNAFGDICTCGLDDLLSTIKGSDAGT